MNCIKELVRASGDLDFDVTVMGDQNGIAYIDFILNKFKPYKTKGHLSIGGEAITIPIEEYEFEYSKYLTDEPVYVFFEQKGSEFGEVVIIKNGNKLCNILEDSFGMEYFVSNKKGDYLIAVNWYVIEGTGTASDWLRKL